MRKYILIAFIILGANILYAQSFEERFRSFQQSVEKEYTSFRDQANKQYADFMRQAWKTYYALPATPAPKDESHPIPPYDEQQAEPMNDLQESENIQPTTIVPQPQPIEAINPPATDAFAVYHSCTFDFYNTPCEVTMPDTLYRLVGATNGEVATAWEQFSNGQYDGLLYDCLQLREQLALCDWGYLNLLYKVATTVYQSTCNEATLLCGWLYCQSGYKMRFALDKETLQLLYASDFLIFNKLSFMLDNQRYYKFLQTSDTLQICSSFYPKEQSLSLHITKTPRFKSDYYDARHMQSKRDSNMVVSVQENRNLLDFYNTYPDGIINNDQFTRWERYANTPLSEETQQMIYPELRKQIAELSPRDAVLKLLNFLQTTLQYKLDTDVWGEDRVFFADETLYYPYADCEDRAILFSRLVRDLTDMPVALVYYPGHVAAAVAIPGEESGAHVMINDQRFTVCDPTYCVAPIGAIHPSNRQYIPKTILLQ